MTTRTRFKTGETVRWILAPGAELVTFRRYAPMGFQDFAEVMTDRGTQWLPLSELEPIQ